MFVKVGKNPIFFRQMFFVKESVELVKQPTHRLPASYMEYILENPKSSSYWCKIRQQQRLFKNKTTFDGDCEIVNVKAMNK